MTSPMIEIFPLPGAFDVIDTLYAIYNTANTAKKNESRKSSEKNQFDKPALERGQKNLFLELLLQKMVATPRRTIDDFSDALDKALDDLKETYPGLGTKRIRNFDEAWDDAMAALNQMKADGLAIVVENIYPIRLMLCWLDALEMVIGAYTAIKQASKSAQGQRSKYRSPNEYWNGVYEVALAAGILLTRIAEQTRGYIANTKRPVEQQEYEDDFIDAFVDALAHDMAYMTRVQGSNHLLEMDEKNEFSKFQDIMLKTYNDTS